QERRSCDWYMREGTRMVFTQSRDPREADTLHGRIDRRRLVAGTAVGIATPATGRRINAQTPQETGTGAVVSSHWAATNTGIEILEAGGTAADAAVAVAAVLTVVEPYFSSALGGGTWGLY